MSGSGKTLLFASHQTIMLRSVLSNIYRDLQTFQYRAVADTFDTVEQMERSRTAYRAALLWMKDLSRQLDPDAYNQMDKFKKVQDHVRKTKKVFEKKKLDSVQKIDLLSASRCNLFSNVFVAYQDVLQNILMKTSKIMNIYVDTFKPHQSYEFITLPELNDGSIDDALESFESKLKQMLSQENINEKDIMIFFESEYSDNQSSNNEPKQGKSTKNRSNGKSKTFANKTKELKQEISTKIDKLLDLDSFKADSNSESDKSQSANDLQNASNHFMPSSLLDLQDKQNNDDLISQIDSILNLASPSQPSVAPSQQQTQNDKVTQLFIICTFLNRKNRCYRALTRRRTRGWTCFPTSIHFRILMILKRNYSIKRTPMKV